MYRLSSLGLPRHLLVRHAGHRARIRRSHSPAATGSAASRIQTAVLVGQSGVGKSSLINRLVPGRPALEGELSATGASGRHTTTASTLYELPGGGAIIDSPGVRGSGAAHGVLVGQPGAGSLVARLVPDADVLTGELARDEEGRHTTTSSRLYDLPAGGALIDSPGVRDFAPAITALEPGSLGFVEVDRLSTGCRFQDCRHLREPGCAVRDAVEAGSLDARRYESYRRLRRVFDDLSAARGKQRR